MIQNHIPKNHISTAVSPMINDMLHKHKVHSPIRYFDYQRIYHNKEMICLTSNIDFLGARINLDQPFIEPSLAEGVFLADEVFPDREIALDHVHDMYTGICIVKQHTDYTETAFFAANKKNKHCISFYLNNTAYLMHFVNEFKEIFHTAITEAELSKISINDKLIGKNMFPLDSCNINPLSGNKLLKRLSKQETFVLHHLLKGKTQNEIADTMNISRSSVSTFLYRIMNKFNCKSRSQLIEQALISGLIQMQPML